MTDDQKQRAEEVKSAIEQMRGSIQDTRETLGGVTDLQLVTLEGLAVTNEEQTINNERRDRDIMNLYGALADVAELLFEVLDRIEGLEGKA